MKTINFKTSDPISILYFLQNVKPDFDRNDIHEDADMRLSHRLMKDSAKAALAHRICAANRDDPQQEGKLTTYTPVVNYLLATYAFDDVLAVVEAEITKFKKMAGTSAVEHSGGFAERHYTVVV